MKTINKLIIFFIFFVCVVCGLVVYKFYFQSKQLPENSRLIQSEEDKKSVTDFTKSNLGEFYRLAKPVYPNISLERATILPPFKSYYLMVDEAKSSKTESQLLSYFKTTESWNVPVRWEDDKGSIIMVKKSGEQWKFDGMILDVHFGKIQKALENVGLGWDSTFYLASINFPNPSSNWEVIFLRKSAKLLAIPVFSMKRERELKPIPALKIRDFLDD